MFVCLFVLLLLLLFFLLVYICNTSVQAMVLRYWNSGRRIEPCSVNSCPFTIHLLPTVGASDSNFGDLVQMKISLKD